MHGIGILQPITNHPLSLVHTKRNSDATLFKLVQSCKGLYSAVRDYFASFKINRLDTRIRQSIVEGSLCHPSFTLDMSIERKILHFVFSTATLAGLFLPGHPLYFYKTLYCYYLKPDMCGLCFAVPASQDSHLVCIPDMMLHACPCLLFNLVHLPPPETVVATLAPQFPQDTLITASDIAQSLYRLAWSRSPALSASPETFILKSRAAIALSGLSFRSRGCIDVFTDVQEVLKEGGRAIKNARLQFLQKICNYRQDWIDDPLLSQFLLKQEPLSVADESWAIGKVQQLQLRDERMAAVKLCFKELHRVHPDLEVILDLAMKDPDIVQFVEEGDSDKERVPDLADFSIPPSHSDQDIAMVMDVDNDYGNDEVEADGLAENKKEKARRVVVFFLARLAQKQQRQDIESSVRELISQHLSETAAHNTIIPHSDGLSHDSLVEKALSFLRTNHSSLFDPYAVHNQPGYRITPSLLQFPLADFDMMLKHSQNRQRLWRKERGDMVRQILGEKTPSLYQALLSHLDSHFTTFTERERELCAFYDMDTMAVRYAEFLDHQRPGNAITVIREDAEVFAAVLVERYRRIQCLSALVNLLKAKYPLFKVADLSAVIKAQLFSAARLGSWIRVGENAERVYRHIVLERRLFDELLRIGHSPCSTFLSGGGGLLDFDEAFEDVAFLYRSFISFPGDRLGHVSPCGSIWPTTPRLDETVRLIVGMESCRMQRILMAKEYIQLATGGVCTSTSLDFPIYMNASSHWTRTPSLGLSCLVESVRPVLIKRRRAKREQAFMSRVFRYANDDDWKVLCGDIKLIRLCIYSDSQAGEWIGEEDIDAMPVRGDGRCNDKLPFALKQQQDEKMLTTSASRVLSIVKRVVSGEIDDRVVGTLKHLFTDL